MNHDNNPHLIRRSPRAAHELQQAFKQIQLDNNKGDYVGDEEDDYSDSDQENPPPQSRSRRDSYDQPSTTSAREAPPRSLSHVNPLRSHPVAADKTPATSASSTSVPRYRFSHPFREQLYAPRQPDPAPRRHPTNLVSYKSANQRFHPRLRKQTSLDTIASVTTTASDVFNNESDRPATPGVKSEPPVTEAPEAVPLPQPLRTASVSSVQSTHPTTPVEPAENSTFKRTASVEINSPKSILQKLKPGKKNDLGGTDGGTERLVIERTVSVDQRSYRSTSSSASNTQSSSTLSRYPDSEAGNSRSSSTWTASSHDISGLTPDEIKKCKKKGINPALFAEMKAARKGKWTSPIAGNTFLS